MICAQTRSGRVRSEHKRNTRLTEDHSNMTPLAHQPISEAFIAVDKFERPKVTEWRTAPGYKRAGGTTVRDPLNAGNCIGVTIP